MRVGLVLRITWKQLQNLIVNQAEHLFTSEKKRRAAARLLSLNSTLRYFCSLSLCLISNSDNSGTTSQAISRITLSDICSTMRLAIASIAAGDKPLTSCVSEGAATSSGRSWLHGSCDICDELTDSSGVAGKGVSSISAITSTGTRSSATNTISGSTTGS